MVSVIESLARDPRPPGCKALVGEPGAYRIRAGDWRVVYTVDDDAILVVVVKLGHRREVYRVT